VHYQRIAARARNALALAGCYTLP